MKIRGKGKCSCLAQENQSECFGIASWAKSTLLVLCLALELGISRAEWRCADWSHFLLRSVKSKKKDRLRLS